LIAPHTPPGSESPPQALASPWGFRISPSTKEHSMEATGSALEQFRRQWKEEVSARSKYERKRQASHRDVPPAEASRSSEEPKRLIPPPSYPLATNIPDDEDAGNSKEEEDSDLANQLTPSTIPSADDDEFTTRTTAGEPKSALEHYETAVEKERQGNLGDSLSHYRRAYRLDASVDLSYKQKHFPAKSNPGNINPSNAPVTVPSTAHHSSKDPIESTPIFTLIASFCGLPILGAPAVIKGDPLPPCPISRLPSEILLEVLRSAATLDPALFARLAVVCKRLAYHVFTEKKIWKRIALGSEFGLGGQLYDFRIEIQGREAVDHVLDSSHGRLKIYESTFGNPADQDWREVFHSHPRIRFTGVYISTVNYTRAGGASATQVTWNTPVHIVTYYRYLRFFRDGTVISLLSTNEPIEVVHHLTKENVALVCGGRGHHPLNFTSSAPAIHGASAQAAPPTAHQLMKHALRGRWRLSHPLAANECGNSDIMTADAGSENEVFIETEGAGPRYLYTMQLLLKSSTKSKHGVKNNKLQWKSFWSYNQLTNDWAPFQLKNDRAFYFSRVKSYGLGY
jgi:F-box protein 9